MKRLIYVVVVDAPDDHAPHLVEHRIDRMLENTYGYDVQVAPVEDEEEVSRMLASYDWN